MGDDDLQTMSNVTVGKWDFDDETFDHVSDEAKDFITKLLVKGTKLDLIINCIVIVEFTRVFSYAFHVRRCHGANELGGRPATPLDGLVHLFQQPR